MKAKIARRLMLKKFTVLEGVFQEVRHVAQQGHDSMYIWSHVAEEYKD